MDMTISLKDAGLLLIGIGLIALIGYCVVFMKNLVVTVKHANKILADVQVVSGITAEKSRKIDKLVDDVSKSVESLSNTIKGNQSVLAALTSIVNATASIKNLLINK